MTTIAVSVFDKCSETSTVCSVELRSTDGRPLPAFSAGAHIDVHIGPDLVRQYSLWNDPADASSYFIGVLKEPESRGGSRAIHETIAVGQTIEISLPKNHFPLQQGNAKSVLFAGGIGITPILSMAYSLALSRDDFEMHYCARSRSAAAFLDRIADATFAQKTHLHFDDGEPAQKLDLDAVMTSLPPYAHLYVCGPRGFIDAVLSQARDKGWPEDQLHYEFFSAAAIDTKDDVGFTVKLASNGQVVPVRHDQAIVQALRDVGINIKAFCEEGVCGTCLTRVLAGEPEHRDSYLTPDEQAQNDQFLPCCSRSKSPELVLDI